MVEYIIAESNCGSVALVEVKKTKDAAGPKIVEDFHERVRAYATRFPDKTILPTFLSLGGFTAEAGKLCEERGIGTAKKIEHF